MSPTTSAAISSNEYDVQSENVFSSALNSSSASG